MCPGTLLILPTILLGTFPTPPTIPLGSLPSPLPSQSPHSSTLQGTLSTRPPSQGIVPSHHPPRQPPHSTPLWPSMIHHVPKDLSHPTSSLGALLPRHPPGDPLHATLPLGMSPTRSSSKTLPTLLTSCLTADSRHALASAFLVPPGTTCVQAALCRLLLLPPPPP